MAPVPRIHEWTDLAADFEGADLFLGNGFAINIDERFGYESLFMNFLEDLEDEDSKARFECLDTHNFELLLNTFAQARRINECFGLSLEAIDHASRKLREGLIQAVGEVHPKYEEFEQATLEWLCDQLAPFEDIYTTNYDAILYHIIMKAKDRYLEGHLGWRYNDYFWARRSRDFLEFRDYQDYPDYRHIYYLHGALFLFDKPNADVKLRRGRTGPELIELVQERIDAGEIPLFVSEGRAEEKRAAVHRSEYLSFARRQLRKVPRPVVVYGFGFSDGDKHVARALVERGERIAVGVYEEDKSEEEAERFCRHVQRELAGCEVQFFSSSEVF